MFMGRFQKKKWRKKIFLTPLGYIIHQESIYFTKTILAVLQLSYREIFIFLNISGKDFTGTLEINGANLHEQF